MVSQRETYYTEPHARAYNQRWRRFTKHTLAESLAMVDMASLSRIAQPSVLDVACGTGVLLGMLLAAHPTIQATGVDASEAMLDQARRTLAGAPGSPRLTLGRLTTGQTAGLPFAPASFDLITCSNAFHYLADPVGALAGLAGLLKPEGQLVIEDYARRTGWFPWAMFERWYLRVGDPQHMRAYTLGEAQGVATRAGLVVAASHAFTVDWLWHGWAMRLTKPGNRG